LPTGGFPVISRLWGGSAATSAITTDSRHPRGAAQVHIRWIFRQYYRHPALVGARRGRHPHPALPQSQRPLGRNLAAAAQLVRSSLTRYLTTARTQTIQASTGYQPVTNIPDAHPTSPGGARMSDPLGIMAKPDRRASQARGRLSVGRPERKTPQTQHQGRRPSRGGPRPQLPRDAASRAERSASHIFRFRDIS
jgi:hypothetical protein